MPICKPPQSRRTGCRALLLCTDRNGNCLGFADVDGKGKRQSFDIDFRRALATAILGRPDKAQIIPVSWAQRFPAIQSGDVDVIIKAACWTMTRETEPGLQ